MSKRTTRSQTRSSALETLYEPLQRESKRKKKQSLSPLSPTKGTFQTIQSNVMIDTDESELEDNTFSEIENAQKIKDLFMTANRSKSQEIFQKTSDDLHP